MKVSLAQRARSALAFFRTPWSLERVVLRELADWTKFNKFRKNHSSGFYERVNLKLASHPIVLSASLLGLYLATLWLVTAIPKGDLNGNFVDWQTSDYLSYFTSLWSVQATIAAVIYPLVISFIAVFLQRRPTAEAFVSLYLLDSGAVSSGLSCLTLVVLMSVEYMLIPYFGIKCMRKAVFLDSVWFILNACFTTYFLARTMRFLKPEAQLEVIKKYAANIALPRMVKRSNTMAVLVEARTKRWLPPEQKSSLGESTEPRIVFSRFHSRGVVQGQLNTKKDLRLTNVRLWLLRIVMESWLEIAQKHKQTKSTGNSGRSYAPVLSLNILPGADYGPLSSLGWVNDGPDLKSWHRHVLRMALSFNSVESESAGIQLSELWRDFESDARDAAAKAEGESFRTAYSRVIDLHKLLLGSCVGVTEKGEIGSWALMAESPHLFANPLHVEWANVHRSIYQAAIGALSLDFGPAKRICHTVEFLDGDELRLSPVEIRIQTLQLPSLLMYMLANWWVQQIEEQGVLEHGHQKMVSLRAPVHRKYEAILMEFIGGWENARTHLATLSDDSEPFTWTRARDLAAISTRHVQDTARFLLEAVARGDTAAATWFADVLSKWWSDLDSRHYSFELHGKTDFLTIAHLQLEWAELISLLRIQSGTGEKVFENLPELQRGVLLAAIENLWADTRILVVEQLLAWALSDEAECLNESLAMEIACGLLNGKRWKPGGDVLRPSSHIGPAEYLVAKVRQYCSGRLADSSYIGRLDQFISRIKDMERPNMIGSRVYSFSGADDVGSLRDLQVVYFALLSESAWREIESVRREIAGWIPEQMQLLDTLSYHVKLWIERIAPVKAASARILPQLVERCERTKSVDERFEFVQAALENFVTFIEVTKNNAIETAQIDPTRLKQIGTFASIHGFEKATGSFPLQLFGDVTHTRTALLDFTLTTNQYRKADLTNLAINPSTASDESHWARLMAQQVGAVVLSDVLRESAHRELIVPTPESYWDALKTEGARIIASGDVPILLLDNATRPAWVWDWQHHSFSNAHTRPDDLQVQRLEGNGDAYVCNFNSIRVYSFPMQPGQSILLSKSSFGELKFTQFENNQFVEVTTKERTDSPLLVDLQLKFSRDVTPKGREIVLLAYRIFGEESTCTSDTNK